MSRAWVWIATGLSAAFLAGTGVLLGARLAAGPQGSPDSGAARTAQLRRVQTVQGEQEEVDRLRRLVATYRQREAVYRQRLEEANQLLRSLDRQEGSWDQGGLRYGSRARGQPEEHARYGPAERWEREEHEGWEHGDED